MITYRQQEAAINGGLLLPACSVRYFDIRLKKRKTNSVIIKKSQKRSSLTVFIDSHNLEHYNFIYNESDKSFDLSLSKRVIPALRSRDLACFEGVRNNVQI